MTYSCCVDLCGSSTGTLRLLAASLINSPLVALGGRPLLVLFHFWMNGSFLCFLVSVTSLPINLNIHFLMESYETRVNTSQFTLKLQTMYSPNQLKTVKC